MSSDNTTLQVKSSANEIKIAALKEKLLKEQSSSHIVNGTNGSSDHKVESSGDIITINGVKEGSGNTSVKEKSDDPSTASQQQQTTNGTSKHDAISPKSQSNLLGGQLSLPPGMSVTPLGRPI